MSAKKSISNSFTVNTVEDGATLTAKSAIHSVGIRCTSEGKSDGSGSSAGMVTLYVDGVAVPTTYLSIKSQPSGLTVLTHTQQSVIPEGGFSISWANNVDRANLEGEVVLTVSYNNYSTEFSIPIICAKDGENGDDGKTYALKLTLPSLVIPCDSSGNSKSSGDKDCYVTFYVDGTAISTSSMTITILSKPSGLTVQTNADISQISKNRIYITYGSNVAKSTLEGVITFSVSDGTNTTYGGIAVMCSQDGGQGERGKTGRFYYFADTFDKNNNTDTYSATDSEAPFFFHNNKYWVWKGDNFTDKTMKWLYDNKGGYPSSNNTNYELMVTDFKYLITEAIFGKYAHFGSAIINGDWMISQNGTYGGNTPIDYTKFDPAYPSTSVYTNHTVNGTTWQGYNFVPNYAVDLLTGKTYMTSAEVRGTIRADNLYHGITFASRAWDGGNVYTSYKWYCMPASIYGDKGYDAKETQQPYYNNFSPCNYYTEEEIATLSGGALTVPQNHGFLMCVGDNDNVYVLPDTYDRFPTIYLPAPEDVPGKVIDVFGFHYGSHSIPNFVVKNVGNPDRGMTSLIYYNSSENRWEAYEAGGTAQATVATNAAMRFISASVTVGSTTTWWWLSVPFYQKEWVQS